MKAIEYKLLDDSSKLEEKLGSEELLNQILIHIDEDELYRLNKIIAYINDIDLNQE